MVRLYVSSFLCFTFSVKNRGSSSLWTYLSCQITRLFSYDDDIISFFLLQPPFSLTSLLLPLLQQGLRLPQFRNSKPLIKSLSSLFSLFKIRIQWTSICYSENFYLFNLPSQSDDLFFITQTKTSTHWSFMVLQLFICSHCSSTFTIGTVTEVKVRTLVLLVF